MNGGRGKRRKPSNFTFCDPLDGQAGLENPPHTTDCMNRWTQRINTDIFVLHEIYQTNPKIAQASLRLFPFSRELKEYARQKI